MASAAAAAVAELIHIDFLTLLIWDQLSLLPLVLAASPAQEIQMAVMVATPRLGRF
jgi:hypothetical protein